MKQLSSRRSMFLIFVLGIFGVAFVNANKSNNNHFVPPANFVLDDSFFLPYFPKEYNYNGTDKISILIPPEIKSKLGSPKTKTGEINPDFLQGKLDFNEQFGIKEWKMEKYNFSQTQFGERLEIEGHYKSFSGKQVNFIEHHYVSPKSMQSIHLYYPADGNKKVVSQAKASLQTFNPNIN